MTIAYNNVVADGDMNADGNYVGGTAPGPLDVGLFDGTSDTNATASAALAWKGLKSAAGYASTIDLDGENLTLGADGLVLDDAGTFDAGEGTIAIAAGPFDNKDAGAYEPRTSTVQMSGTGTLTGANANPLYNLTVDAGAVITADESFVANGTVALNGSLSMDVTKTLYTGGLNTITIGAAGALTGDGTCTIGGPETGEGLTVFAAGGTVDIATLIFSAPQTGSVLASGTYRCGLVKIRNTGAAIREWVMSAGPYIFQGNVEFENTNAGGSLEISADTNNPDVTYQGDVVWDETAGTLLYTAGTGDITLLGTADQDIDFGGSTIENVTITKETSGDVTIDSADFELQTSTLAGALTFANSTITAVGTLTATGSASKSWDLDGQTVAAIVVDKSAGTLTFTGGWTADSYTQSAGTVDFNGQTLATIGNWTMTGGAIADPESSNIIVGGALNILGIDLAGTAPWTLSVAGSGHMQSLHVTNCDASGGKTIIAYGCTHDEPNTNTNIRFSPVSSGRAMRSSDRPFDAAPGPFDA